LLVNGWGASQALLDGEPLRVADSLTDALACVLTQAIELRELPDDVSMDENATVRLARAGRLLVKVRRWQPPPTPSAQAELAARTPTLMAWASALLDERWAVQLGRGPWRSMLGESA
jgi:hypothetical protein